MYRVERRQRYRVSSINLRFLNIRLPLFTDELFLARVDIQSMNILFVPQGIISWLRHLNSFSSAKRSTFFASTLKSRQCKFFSSSPSRTRRPSNLGILRILEYAPSYSPRLEW